MTGIVPAPTLISVSVSGEAAAPPVGCAPLRRITDMTRRGILSRACACDRRTLELRIATFIRRCMENGQNWLLRMPLRTPIVMPRTTYPPLLLLVLFASALFRIAEACSSRSTPKPRPPTATMRPNITFQTYTCPEDYAKWYCLNGATCFFVRIGESILYNCECADGFVGQRCEFKDLAGSYLPVRKSIMIERASIAGGVSLAVVIIVVISIVIYVYVRRREKEKLMIEELERKPFGSHSTSERQTTPTNVCSKSWKTSWDYYLHSST